MKREDMILRNKPWRDEAAIPQQLLALKGLLSPEERRLCYWLGRNWFSGSGCIVDTGAFLGATTACFAAGIVAAGLRRADHPNVYAYDRFEVVDEYIAGVISRDVRPAAQGDRFLDIFEDQTAPYAEMVRACPGDILDQRWGSESVEVLLIDLATSPEINAHIIRQFFPSLVPGRSMVIYKAYHHCWHPYVHVGMEYMADAFELIEDRVPYQSRMWRLVKPLSGESISRLARRDMGREERLNLLDRLISSSSLESRPMVEVVRLWQLILDQDYEQAKADFARIDQTYSLEGRKELWANQARQMYARLSG